MTLSTSLLREFGRTIVPLLAITAISSPLISYAQQKYKIDVSPPQQSRYVKEHIIDAGDAPGHQLRIVEIEKTYTSNHPVVKGVKITDVRQWAFTNYTNGIGPVIFYETWSDGRGNTFFVEGTSETQSQITATGSRRGTSSGSGRITGGTGKFATIQGILAGHTEFDSDPKNGYNRNNTNIEYWFRN
ncbi:MAG: hypothetical protein JSU95_14565 [Betaproteobacteria bacterium]|nr:MAG: hypothetical protein JSU95_14565 [Betaproteobacteria bacterium]